MYIKPTPHAKLMKKVFDLCDMIGDGVHGKLHLVLSLDNQILPPEETKQQYRGYHGDGYCFTITKERCYTESDEYNSCEVDGFEYDYADGEEFEGFKPLPLKLCQAMLLNI